MAADGAASSGAMEPEGGDADDQSAVGSRQSAEEETGGAAAATGVEAAGEAASAETAPSTNGLDEGQLARLREVLVAAHPDAVPELIAGADFDALLGSVAGARSAFARVREETARAAAGSVPRGGGTREIDPAVFAGLSPEGKIAQGLRGR